MGTDLTRRRFIGMAGAAAGAVAGVTGAAAQPQARRIRIVGISCSPRRGKTTAAAVKVCLDAAGQVSPNIDTELIDLGGMSIEASLAAGIPLKPGQSDDFPQLVARLSSPAVAGIIVGSPVYFGDMSSLCKAFLDRCIAFRKNGFALSDKVAGAVAVGGARNGGQELTIRSIQTALMCQEMIIVGDGRPSGRIGATLWNKADDISHDEFGLGTARNLGRRVGQLALRLAAVNG